VTKLQLLKSRTKTALALTIASVFVAGCTTTGSIYEPESLNASIEMATFEVRVLDSREQVDDRTLKVPITSFIWDEDKVSPRLPESFKQLAEETVRESQSDGASHLIFEVQVLEAYQVFDRTALREVEEVQFEIVVHMKQVLSDKTVSVRAKAGGRRVSPDASRQRVQKMFQQAFQDAMVKALNKLAADREINNH